MKDFTLIDAGISGGTLKEYLAKIMEQCGQKCRLVLTPVQRKFYLPCHDGQGEEISEQELDSLRSIYPFSYSEALCTNYLYIKSQNAVVLFDDENSMQKKKQLAYASGIPILEKNKTP